MSKYSKKSQENKLSSKAEQAYSPIKRDHKADSSPEPPGSSRKAGTKTGDKVMSSAANGDAGTRLEALDPVGALKVIHPQGPWSLVAFEEGKRVSATFQIDQEAEARQWVTLRNGKFNLYFYSNRLKANFAGAKASRADVAEILYLQADLDIKDSVDWLDPIAVGQRKSELLTKLLTYYNPPTIVWFTGGGYQALWKLRGPVPGDKWDLVEIYSKIIARDLDGDNVQSSEHIFRLPGSTNVLNASKIALHRKPERSHLVYYNPKNVYDLEDFTLPEKQEYKRAAVAKVIKSKHVKPLIDMIAPVLNLLPADCHRDTWRDIIFGVQEFSNGDEQFYEMLDRWSAKGKKYNPKELKVIWDYANRDTRPEARITISKLFEYVRKRTSLDGSTESNWPSYPLAYLVENIKEAKNKPGTREAEAAVGAPFTEENLYRAGLLKYYIPSEYYNLKEALKAVTSVTAWDKAVDKALRGADVEEAPKSAAQVAVEIAKSAITLSRTAEGAAIATMQVDGHEEHYLVKSSAFKQWLISEYRERTNCVVDRNAIAAALDTIEADARKAKFTEVHIRVAENDGKHYLDLCNDDWQVVEMSAYDDWQIITNPPVKFIRNKGMLPLPIPIRHTSMFAALLKLRRLINVRDKYQFTMFIANEAAAMRPKGPYPILVPNSVEGGAGKTTVSEFATLLIDPVAVPLAAPPEQESDLVATIHSRHMSGFDNISGIKRALSDAFCRVSTGAGFSKRKLYEDFDVVAVNFQKPLVLNGIGDIIKQSDLLQRSLILQLEKLKKNGNKDENEIREEFKTAHPYILAALLDIFSHGLTELPRFKNRRFGRMAAFEKFSLACESAYNRRPIFEEAYRKIRLEGVEAVTDGDPVVTVISYILSTNNGEFKGNSTTLLKELNKEVSNVTVFRNDNNWPDTPDSLGRWLGRNSDKLSTLGITIKKARDTRVYTLSGEKGD
jgi:hypothetical protein